MSTTWKTAAVAFGFGVVSTGLVALGADIIGAILWGVSVFYIGYSYYKAKKG
jgi:hypothetical protein